MNYIIKMQVTVGNLSRNSVVGFRLTSYIDSFIDNILTVYISIKILTLDRCLLVQVVANSILT